VLKAVIASVAGGQSLDVETLIKSIDFPEGGSVEGKPVSTGTHVSPVSCSQRPVWDVPAPQTWALICAEGGTVTSYSFSGDPGVPAIDGGLITVGLNESIEFSYYLDEALQQASKVSIRLQDVSALFRGEWLGHLPFMNDAYSFSRPGKLLMIVQTDRGRLQGRLRPAVTSITIYTRP
jgi:hypothetical protein